jgi:hypothetical protein
LRRFSTCDKTSSRYSGDSSTKAAARQLIQVPQQR